MSLATDFRPKDFDEVLGQVSTVKILQRQLECGKISNCYLFAGPSGDGKTTLARILASKINQGKGSPIEIDGASNNGVEAVRDIIADAEQRSIDSEYKVFIIDECHCVTTAGWNAFLKCIEEPPKYTIFMFCTTNPEKIPDTILNRVIRFNLTKVDTQLIKNRLLYIAHKEGFVNYEEACDYIAKLSEGGVRTAISYLEKCSHYSTDLSINNVLACLGNFSYESFFNLTNYLIDGDEGKVLNMLTDFYNSGNDLKLFIEQYLDFVLDLTKYCIFQDMDQLKIPISLTKAVQYTTNIEDNLKYYNLLVDKVLAIKNAIKYDVNNRTTIEVMFINICRGV